MTLAMADLSGQDGNVFAVVARAKRALVKAGYRSEADQMVDRVFQADSYDEALRIMLEYVEDGAAA